MSPASSELRELAKDFGPREARAACSASVARARIAQAFGRLIRRGDDKGVFLMLDAATPTRLFASLPPGTEVQRMSLADAVELTRSFLNPEKT